MIDIVHFFVNAIQRQVTFWNYQYLSFDNKIITVIFSKSIH